MRFAKTHLAMLCMVLFAIVVMAGCGSAVVPASKSTATSTTSSSSATASIEGLKREQTLTVGIRSASSAPFVVDSSGALSGMDVDLGNSLALELGLSVEFVTVDDVAAALQQTCDVVMNVSAGEAQGFDVVGDYAQTAHALFHEGSSTIVSVDALNRKVIAVQDGSSAQMALHVTAPDAYETLASTLNEAFDALAKGEADYVLCNSNSGAYLSAWQEDIGFAGLFDQPTVQGIALSSGDGAVQTAVRGAYDQIRQNGVLAEIRRCWLGDFPVLTAESVIAGVSPKEATDEAPQQTAGSEEIVGDNQNGSTAGANAVSSSEAHTTSATSALTSTPSQNSQNTSTNVDYTEVAAAESVEVYEGVGGDYDYEYTDYGYSEDYAESYDY